MKLYVENPYIVSRFLEKSGALEKSGSGKTDF
jgi:hypothetical protein